MASDEIEAILHDRVVKAFRLAFHEVTGMCTSFWFPGVRGGRADCVPARAKCGCCRLIQSSQRGLAQCVSDDEGCIRSAAPEAGAIIHTCFAGLTGITIPVGWKGRVRGMIAAGEVLTAPPDPASFGRVRAAVAGLDLDVLELEKRYGKIPVVPRGSLGTAADLLLPLVAYIMDRRQAAETVRKLRGELLASLRVQEAAEITADEATRGHRLVRQVMAFVDSRCAEDIRLADAAAHVHLSPGYLSHVFHAGTGCTFKQYLTRRRIEKACGLLADLRLNVSEVSMRAGFDNVNYFAEVFKKVVGMPPREYRNRVRPASSA
jgi:AraC-like DNA-binding protein/ligand-binding sensor protein